MSVQIQLVTCGETRDIHRVTDHHGNTLDLIPDETSHRYWMKVKLPDGVEVQAEISAADYENHVAPALGPLDVSMFVDTDDLSRHLP